MSDKATAILSPTETIECPLCCGAGKLKRTEVLDRLGVKDFARVAQLSAEEAFRLLSQKHTNDHPIVWARFETELTKRTAEIEQRYRDELWGIDKAELYGLPLFQKAFVFHRFKIANVELLNPLLAIR